MLLLVQLFAIATSFHVSTENHVGLEEATSLERVDLQMRSICCRLRCRIDLTIARQAIIASRIDSDHSFANKVVTMEQSSCIVKMSSFWQ